MILLADSDPFALKLLSDVCEGEGHQIITAADGPAVLDILARERPDLIIVDEALPRIGGKEVCTIIKSEPHLRTIPLILCNTTTIEDKEKIDPLEHEPDDYLVKPLRTLDIQHRLRAGLKAAELRRRLEVAEGRLRSLSSGDSLPIERRAFRRLPSETLEDRFATSTPSSDRSPDEPGSPRQLRLTLEYEMPRAIRYGHPLALVLITRPTANDKSNDKSNDKNLALIVPKLRSLVREVDQTFWQDHTSLALVLPDTDARGAQALLRRLYRSLVDDPTLQFGSAALSANVTDPEQLLSTAQRNQQRRARRAALKKKS